MIQFDEQKKLAKFQKFQLQLQKDVAKKNKPKMWEEIDDLEKQQRQVLYSDDQLSPQSKRKRLKKIKPDKNIFRLNLVKQYEKALQKHRSECKYFYDPKKIQKLNMDRAATIKVLKQAKDRDKDIPLALKKVGIKSLKTLFLKRAHKHFQLVIDFLNHDIVPEWMYEAHRQLLNKKQNQFKATVKGSLRP